LKEGVGNGIGEFVDSKDQMEFLFHFIDFFPRRRDLDKRRLSCVFAWRGFLDFAEWIGYGRGSPRDRRADNTSNPNVGSGIRLPYNPAVQFCILDGRADMLILVFCHNHATRAIRISTQPNYTMTCIPSHSN
jgi:hypothetical protein